ncbi:hypothetical protein JCM13304A_08310 [Desulfothermus okinawensis JCM 13304]
MRIRYDPDTDTLTIVLKDDPIVESEYREGKGVVVDYNEKNEIVSYEIMGWSRFQNSGQDLFLEKVEETV